MGGRGASAKSWDEYQDILDQLYPRYKPKTKYNYTESSELPPGAHHAFFSEKNRAFTIITYSTEENRDELNILPQHSFGHSQPAIRWVSDGQVNEVYLDAMTTEEFMEVTGIRFDLHKGGYVLSKRISRAFREYYVQGFFPDDEVRIHYLPVDEMRDKIWDGAGLISRKMLLKMKLEPLERAIEQEKDEAKQKKLSAKHVKLSRELRTAKRIEFTIQSEKGQDKGHAIVAEELFDDDGNEMDFILIEDTKREVALNGRKWVGINFVHGHDHMRLDIQSLIHLQEFLDIDALAGYIQEEGKLFIESLQNGTAGQAMKRIDKHETVEEVQNWAIREFVASGGDVRWSPQLIKTIANQHLKRLNESTIEKLRIPIPGGRHYCLPAAVGRRAGLNIQVERGEIKIDSENDTAWINDEDWLELEDSPKDPETGKGQGLAAIWGGADNDDALWLFGFTDEKDGEKKYLLGAAPISWESMRF